MILSSSHPPLLGDDGTVPVYVIQDYHTVKTVWLEKSTGPGLCEIVSDRSMGSQDPNAVALC
jgi:hypothetical protein